jgi:hypothetical protein
MNNENQKISITWDDVNKVKVDQSLTSAIHARGIVKNAGYSTLPVGPSESVLMKGWFYLGLAGLVGAFLAWMICEPNFNDGVNDGWGAAWMSPLVIIFVCISLGTVESLIERSWHRASLRALASACISVVLGLLFYFIAGFIYLVIKRALLGFGVPLTISNPLYWLARAFAWAVLGIAGGLVFGIVSKSGKKAYYGMLGGFIGGAIGGFLFDPVNIITGANQGAEVSRAIGFSILGVSTGIAIGLVESALKERWLYVTGGPLAGKQFVLYQDQVTMGKLPSSTIYLFKDPEILEQHAIIEKRSGKSLITAFGPVLIAGHTLHSQMQRTLNNGDVIKIGRYTFTYAEKDRAQ